MSALETNSGPRTDLETARRAEPPRIPASTRELERASAERDAYIADRERTEQRSILRGLLILAVVVLVVSIVRAGLPRVFPHGWWRP